VDCHFPYSPVVERVEKTFVALQGMNTLLCEQRKVLSKLSNDLQQRANIEGSLTQDEMQRFAAALQESQSHESMIDNFCVKREKILEAIDEAGQFV
jgi:hypothetical protein